MNNVQDRSSPTCKKPRSDRRANQREKLVDCAEGLIRAKGLAALRARDLAREMECAVGAIYNLVTDLDELVLLVAHRTNGKLGAHLDAAALRADGDVLVAWARAYFRFARDNRAQWLALFEFRLPPGRPAPAWLEADQAGLFARLEDRLLCILPGTGICERRLKARILFSAVHGIVALALEEKLGSMPADVIEEELRLFVRAYVRGLREEGVRGAKGNGAMPPLEVK